MKGNGTITKLAFGEGGFSASGSTTKTTTSQGLFAAYVYAYHNN